MLKHNWDIVRPQTSPFYKPVLREVEVIIGSRHTLHRSVSDIFPLQGAS